METSIAVFRGMGIRKTIHSNEWWFVIVDVVSVLTDSANPTGYIKDMRRRDKELSKGWGQIATPLLIETFGGTQKINCANTERMFRIIRSIPSPKAEPFKRWLATKRARALYKAKGYSDDWIEKRMRGIAIREELTDKWKEREVMGENEYAILTAEIAKAAFGVTPSEHKKLKGLIRENLRDQTIFSPYPLCSTLSSASGSAP